MTVAVVDGYSTARFLVGELSVRGVDCVHLHSKEKLTAEQQSAVASAAYTIDLGYLDNADDAVSKLQEFDITQVVAGTEAGVTLADTLNYRMGMPGNEIEKIRARRDKFAMANCLRQAGLSAPSSFVTDTTTDAVEWFEANRSAPVVVKPVSSAATDNVRVCRTAKQVEQACSSVLHSRDFFDIRNTRVMIQEYLEGDLYIVNTVTVGGVHKVSDVWLSVKAPGPDGAPIHNYRQTMPRDDPTVKAVISYATAAVETLGIANGAAHSEIMHTSGGPVLIETGARLMGAVLPSLLAEYSGTSHVHLLALAISDPAAFRLFDDMTVEQRKVIRDVWLINHYDGLSRSISWRGKYAALPTHRTISSTIEPGIILPRTVDMITSPGIVSLVSESIPELDRDYRAIRTLEEEAIYLT
ncbi:ATP-grasp domain-containing protein [Nocardia suismassiliense]|uniref:ATP-grasp domain-containing protein n=1 Tax=Nocardia suismassiliense TaxID=2077092 RepID=A0ABW6QMF2_9NOCA